MERRMHTRHRAATMVYIAVKGRARRLFKAVNLSAGGVGVLTEGLQLAKGSEVELSFAINLGVITKIHRRRAYVRNIHNGITGFQMEAFT